MIEKVTGFTVDASVMACILSVEIDQHVAIAVHCATLPILQHDGWDRCMDDRRTGHDVARRELAKVVDVRLRHPVLGIDENRAPSYPRMCAIGPGERQRL